MATSFQFPPQFLPQQQAIERRRMLADMLLQRATQAPQGQMVGNYYVGPGLAGAVTPLLSALASKKISDKADTDSAALAQQYNTGLGEALNKYMTTRDGRSGAWSSGQAQQLMENNQVPDVPDFSPPDPRRAAVEAMTSNYGPLQQLGQLDVKALAKQEGALTTKDILSLTDYDPKTKLLAALSGDPSKLTPKQKEHVVEGQIVVGSPDGTYTSAGDFRPQFGGVEVVGKDSTGRDIMGQKKLPTGEVKFAPAGTNVRVDTGTKAADKFAEKVSEKRATILEKSYEDAQTAKKLLDSVDAAKQDLAAGIKTGASADINLALSKWAQALGLSADPTIANTEAFRANMARETFALVKQLGSGTGISNADREYAEKASGGQIKLDDKSMLRLMNIARAGAANVLMDHTRLIGKNMKASGAQAADLETFSVPFNFQADSDVMFDERTGRFRAAAPAQPPSIVPPVPQRPAAPGTVPVDQWLSR